MRACLSALTMLGLVAGCGETRSTDGESATESAKAPKVAKLTYTVEALKPPMVDLKFTAFDAYGKPMAAKVGFWLAFVQERPPGAKFPFRNLCDIWIEVKADDAVVGADGAPSFQKTVKLPNKENCTRPQGDDPVLAQVKIRLGNDEAELRQPASPEIRALLVEIAKFDVPPGEAEEAAAIAAAAAKEAAEKVPTLTPEELKARLDAEVASLGKLVPLVEPIKFTEATPSLPCADRLPAGVLHPPSYDHEALRRLAKLPSKFPAEAKLQTSIPDKISGKIPAGPFDFLNSAGAEAVLRHAAGQPALAGEPAHQDQAKRELVAGEQLIRVYRAFNRIPPRLISEGIEKAGEHEEWEKGVFQPGVFDGVVVFIDRKKGEVVCWAPVNAGSSKDMKTAKKYGSSEEHIASDFAWNVRKELYTWERMLAPGITPANSFFDNPDDPFGTGK